MTGSVVDVIAHLWMEAGKKVHSFYVLIWSLYFLDNIFFFGHISINERFDRLGRL